MRNLALSAAVFTAALTPTLTEAAGFCDVHHQVLVSQNNSGISQSMTWLIDNQADYCAAWDMIYANSFPPPPCNTNNIDFTQETAILVALGTRSNGCYNVNVACVHEFTPNAVGVGYVETQPGPGCLCTSVITTPVQLIKVPNTYSRARYLKINRQLQCLP